MNFVPEIAFEDKNEFSGSGTTNNKKESDYQENNDKHDNIENIKQLNNQN